MFHRRPILSWGDLALAGSVVSLLFAHDSGVALVEATFSIAATDSATQRVGAAGASCVPNRSIYEFLYHGVPGQGVLITQANPPYPDSPVTLLGESLLQNGTDPAVIIDAITDPTLDTEMETIPTCDEGINVTYEEYKLRQYGCVDLMGRAAGYEDPTLKEYYSDLCFQEGEGKLVNYTQEHDFGSVGTFTYSAQANICTYSTVPSVVENFVGRNDSDVGCDLADRLYKAVSSIPLMFQEAKETEDVSLLAGDVRCFVANGAFAAGMFLHVDNPDGTELVHIDILGIDDPYPAFKDAYESWRVNNSCPETADLSSTDAPSSAAVGETKMPTATPSGGTSLISSIHQTAALLLALVIANPYFP